MKALLVLALSATVAGAELRAPLGLDAAVPAPEENRLTREKVQLGRRLFFDSVLSRDRSLSCATCHDPKQSFTDGKALAEGVGGRRGPRRSPVIFNRAYGRAFFWDGRAATLEDQVVQPILNHLEMDLTIPEALERLRADAGIRAAFERAFGRGPDETALRQALASYVRTIFAGDSPFDRYLAGKPDALSPEARKGLELFRGKAGCVVCHLGPNLTDEGFHNTGLAWNGSRFVDEGRAKVTGDERDRGAFKTPSLRQVAQRPPYMHDGSLKTLAEVIDYYDQGGRANPALDADVQKLSLTADEKRSILALLETFTGTVVEGWP
jgi:cytochrome c peroxidase